MKKFKVMLSVFMVILIICVSVAPTFAVIAPEDSVNSVISWSDKIDKLVWDKIDEASDDEKIPVWVWFTDIDKSNIETMVEKETGLTKDDLSVKIDVATEDLISALDTASNENSETARMSASSKMKLYLESTKEARDVENKRTNDYLRTKRRVSGELYEKNNQNIIDKLKIKDKDIFFQSTLTPSAIVYITKNEIINIAKSDSVVCLNFYDDRVYDEPNLVANQHDTMQVDAVYEQFGLSGSGVNVLQYELTYVNIKDLHFDDIPYKNNIVVIRDAIEHQPDDYEYFSSLSTDYYSGNPYHANLMAATLQDLATDVFIYSVADKKFADIEWALKNKDIDVINASTSLSSPTNYYNDPYAKWFDGLVSEYDITLIASAGNSIVYNEDGTIKENIVLSPACGYNSIAVGAYATNGVSRFDVMRNFKFGHTVSTNLPNYKPDVVVAAGSTSEAAPLLSGIVSMMIELEPSLSAQPEVIKSILMASCHRKVKPYGTGAPELITDGLTQKQGAGAVDAYRALKIVIDGTYGSKTVVSPGVSPTASFALADNDDINVSIAWSRENTNNSVLNTTLGTLQELELRVYNGNNLLGSSLKTNAGKQMVYLENRLPNTTYSIRVNKTKNNTEPLTYGYAWSGKNYVQAEMELNGKKAVGQTVSAELTYIDGNAVPDSDATYVWKNSSDGATWKTIIGANSSTYVLTSTDLLKYIKCEATLLDDTLSGATDVSAITDTKTILYGDADLDGSVSVFDVTLIQSYLAKLKTLNDDQLAAADVDGDGSVSSIDVTYVQQYLAQIITVFPAEQN